MTKLERDLLGTLKACVQVLENHARHLNSDERRQMRRAWVLFERAMATTTEGEKTR
jgi:hypothetical protein